jgi:hypothetical protein
MNKSQKAAPALAQTNVGTEAEQPQSTVADYDKLTSEANKLRAACIAISESVPCQSDHCRHYGLAHGKPCDVEAVRMVRAALAEGGQL